jgi:hypothetical protein
MGYIIINAITFLANAILFSYKMVNISKAKKLNVTEKEYYLKNIFPKLNTIVKTIFYFD